MVVYYHSRGLLSLNIPRESKKKIINVHEIKLCKHCVIFINLAIISRYCGWNKRYAALGISSEFIIPNTTRHALNELKTKIHLYIQYIDIIVAPINWNINFSIVNGNNCQSIK